MKQNVRDTIVELIEKKVEKAIDDKELIKEIDMDSIEYIELIVDIEKIFHIEFGDDELAKTAFMRVVDIIEYVKEKVIDPENICTNN